MKRKMALLLAVLMILSVGLAGCGGSEPTAATATEQTPASGSDSSSEEVDQVLRINWGSNPPDLDPATTTDQVSIMILNDTLEGLIRLNQQGEAVIGSGLAETMTVSEDGTVYTFVLRDATWDDGSAITASDVLFSWQRVVNPETAAQYAYQMYPIKNAQAISKGEMGLEELGLKVIDEKTLEVTLERPTPYFLSLLGFVTYYPVQEAKVLEYGDAFATAPEYMVSSGPFKVETWMQEQELDLVKNETYWDAETVKLDRIKGDMLVDLNTPINLYETGELDTIGVPSEYLDKYRDSDDFISMPMATTWYMQYNCQDAFFSNVKIRKAFSMALNRSAFVDNVLANGSVVAGAYVPNGIPGKDGGDFTEQTGISLKDAGTEGPAAIEEANRLLDEGLSEIGRSRADLAAHVTYLTGESDVAKKFGQAFQQMWKQALGIDVPIEAVSFAIRLDKYNSKEYTISLAGWGADYNDPMTFLDTMITDGGNNNAFWSSAEYDALIEKATVTQGDERMDAMIAAARILDEEMPIAPIYYRARNVIEKSYVKDLVRFPVGVDNEFKWAYIEK
jgi:oligopeptide transport system substrate-binding protein